MGVQGRSLIMTLKSKAVIISYASPRQIIGCDLWVENYYFKQRQYFLNKMIDIFEERQRSSQSGAPLRSFGAPLLTLVLRPDVKGRSVRFADALGSYCFALTWRSICPFSLELCFFCTLVPPPPPLHPSLSFTTHS